MNFRRPVKQPSYQKTVVPFICVFSAFFQIVKEQKQTGYNAFKLAVRVF